MTTKGYSHVASDIPLEHQFLNPNDTQIQPQLDQQDFVTRLTINGTKIDQKEATKILGCWIEEDPGKWGRNTRELVKLAYSRISMITKLKYVGVQTTDLLDIYKLFASSRAEYMSVAWHSSQLIRARKLKIYRRLP